jgi:hypothetical protein
MYHISLKTVGLTKNFNLYCNAKNNINCISYDDGKYIYSMYYIKTKDTELKYNPNNHTYYFLMQLNRSMLGIKNHTLLDSLALLFNSLDSGCYFNIYTFDDNFSLMYDKDRIYTEK